MASVLTKADVLKAVQDLPDRDLTLEEVIERLIVIQKVRIGLSEEGLGVPHDDVVEQFRKPRKERDWG